MALPRIAKDMFINGQFVKSATGKTFTCLNPANEAVVAEIQQGSTQDIDNAVQAARNAF